MKRGSQIVVCLLGIVLAIAIPYPSFAQKHQAAQPPPPPPRAEVSHPQQNHSEGRGHAGDFLRRYGDLPPDEQEQALEGDPDFHRLSPARQEKYRERLRKFSSLPPQEQLRILNRMETWEHLTPEQKQEARQVFAQMRQLPEDRRGKVKDAVRELSSKSVSEREQTIDSPQYKNTFSDEEREIMRRAARLPLAPPQTEESGPQE